MHRIHTRTCVQVDCSARTASKLGTSNTEAAKIPSHESLPIQVDPNEAGLVEPLGKIMSQLVGGGGAAKVNIDKVTDELNKLGERYPFKIPPFFALILRAFSVIEGIALKVGLW